MKTKSKPIKILATFFVALFVLTGAVSISACGFAITDGYVVALSGAVDRTLEYEGSYTISADLSDKMAYEKGRLTWEDKAKYSYESSEGIEYTYESYDLAFSTPVNYSMSYVTETYVLADSLYGGSYLCYDITNEFKSTYSTQSCFYSLSSQLSYFNLFGISRLSGLSTVSELNDVVLRYVRNIGYSGSEEDISIKMNVLGGKYTMSASFEGGELSVAVTVTDGMISKISEHAKTAEEEQDFEADSDIEISYEYKPSLASHFSKLDSWEN